MPFTQSDPDFVHPPSGVKPLMLGGILHDACIEQFGYHAESGIFTLGFSQTPVSEHLGLPPETVYFIAVQDVCRLNAQEYISKINRPTGVPQTQDRAEYRREWAKRYVGRSMGWADFEALYQKGPSADIHGGSLIQTPEGVALSLAVMIPAHDTDYGVEVAGLSLRCYRSDGVQTSIEELRDSGNQYWTARVARRPTS